MKLRRWVGLVVLVVMFAVPAIVVTRWWLRESVPAAPGAGERVGNVLRLSEAKQQNAGVTIVTVRSVSRSLHVEAPGMLVVDESRTARIGSLVDGKMGAVLVGVGDRIAAGAKLATIRSAAVSSAWAEYRKAVADRKRHETELGYAVEVEARAQRLYRDKAISLQELRRARVERMVAEQALMTAKTEVRRAEDVLQHLRLVTDEDFSEILGREIPVESPLQGAVLERFVTAGTAVTPGMPLFVVSDLSVLWAVAEVDEIHLSRLQVGQVVEVGVAAYPGEQFAGVIGFVGDMLDPKTRRVTVRCQVKNPQERLKPQMYATVVLKEGEARNIAEVPSEAVQTLDGKTVVFVVEDAGTFATQEVQIGLEKEGWTEVLSGVKAGEKIVAGGSFLLKAELRKPAEEEE
ncbi:MAG: efflux RND transporter periplasmic adaptor subunit [Candidatus Binatia bacterium]